MSVPLALYIHFPWCVKKCPYCDFNSHGLQNTAELPELLYIQALLADLKTDIQRYQSILHNREIHSIFMGGGTPSLFSPESIKLLLNNIFKIFNINHPIEITLEANPGTIDQEKFGGFREAGINRLSLGIQSFNPVSLKKLGRIHDHTVALRAVTLAREAGFNNINLDMMQGLPAQQATEALADIQQAMDFLPAHFSWYQLTIEPNTLFYQQPPVLPSEAMLEKIEKKGSHLLKKYHYTQYEISAWSQPGFECKHNLNYWQFGDYIGIGAGAHGKLTDQQSGKIYRTVKYHHPKQYLSADTSKVKNFYLHHGPVNPDQVIFEFMLNSLRLYQPVFWSLLRERTVLPDSFYVRTQDKLTSLAERNLIHLDHDQQCFEPTALGRRFLNTVLAEFIT